MTPSRREGVLLIGALLVAAWIPGCNSGRQDAPLRLSAAASLVDVLTELAPGLERATGSELSLNFGGSGTLARQILAGGGADLFFAADERWLDELSTAGLVDGDSRRSPLSNQLVVVVPRESELEITSVAALSDPRVERVAIAEPEAVPVGRYAKGWLVAAGAWDRLAPRVIPTLDARATLAAVASGTVDAGVVYRTDALGSRRARIAFAVPRDEGPTIRYGLVALRTSPRLAAARAAITWLCGDEAAEVFRRHGFLVPRSDE